MPNYEGNKNIALHGQATQFGAKHGLHPNSARQRGCKPWAIRNAVREIGGLTADPSKEITLDYIIELYSQGRILTGAELIACVLFYKGISGNLSAMARLEKMTDV